jgi:hypothetical protein
LGDRAQAHNSSDYATCVYAQGKTMKSASDPAAMPEEKRAIAPGASPTLALTDCVEIDSNFVQLPGFPGTDARPEPATVRWVADLRCPSCGLIKRKVQLEPFGRKILQCPDCDIRRWDRNDLIEAVIVLLSLPILIAIAFLAFHIR